MAGASSTHVVITLKFLQCWLRNHLRGKGSQAYIAETKAHIETMDI
jgi:hypothetical protein